MAEFSARTPWILLSALILCLLAATGFLASYPKDKLVETTWLITLSNKDVWKILSREPHVVYGNGHDHVPAAIKDAGKQQPRVPYNASCFGHDESCPAIKDDSKQPQFPEAEVMCPFYFNYIHEDMEPWSFEYTGAADNRTIAGAGHLSNSEMTEPDGGQEDHRRIDRIGGISKEMLDDVTHLADFRVVIQKGKVYVQTYRACYQSRAILTIWGFLQLVKYYPGLVPDVDFLFGCGDAPHVNRAGYTQKSAPPVFRYCTTSNHLDIPLPDWSFWGWPEIDLRPWDEELTDILRMASDLQWKKRRPTAFWKGNSRTGGKVRRDLISCNRKRHGVEVIHQDWRAAAKSNYADSRLAQQCKNRYKIYAEGQAWSVSLKYIVACDSPVLLIDPVFEDFFSRGLMPMEHFWPVRRDNICKSIKFGVEWGNHNLRQAQMLGTLGSRFVSTEVSMDHVYAYMFHALQEYAKLLRFEPTAGDKMREVTAEEMVSQAREQRIKEVYEKSMVKEPSRRPPCLLQSPAARSDREKLMEGRRARKERMTRAVREAERAGNWKAVNIDLPTAGAVA